MEGSLLHLRGDGVEGSLLPLRGDGVEGSLLHLRENTYNHGCVLFGLS